MYLIHGIIEFEFTPPASREYLPIADTPVRASVSLMILIKKFYARRNARVQQPSKRQ